MNKERLKELINLIYNWSTLKNVETKKNILEYKEIIINYISKENGFRLWGINYDIDDLIDIFKNNQLNVKERELYSFSKRDKNTNIVEIIDGLNINEDFGSFIYTEINDVFFNMSNFINDYKKYYNLLDMDSLDKIKYLINFYSHENEMLLIDSIKEIEPLKLYSDLPELENLFKSYLSNDFVEVDIDELLNLTDKELEELKDLY